MQTLGGRGGGSGSLPVAGGRRGGGQTAVAARPGPLEVAARPGVVGIDRSVCDWPAEIRQELGRLRLELCWGGACGGSEEGGELDCVLKEGRGVLVL